MPTNGALTPEEAKILLQAHNARDRALELITFVELLSSFRNAPTLPRIVKDIYDASLDLIKRSPTNG